MKAFGHISFAVFVLIAGSCRIEHCHRRPVRRSRASHISVYSSDLAKTEFFYVHDLGGVKREDPENSHGVRYYFSPIQFVEVLPIPSGPPSINRLDHVAYNTASVEELRLSSSTWGWGASAR